MGDGAKIDKQAAANALGAWDDAAGDADHQFAAQSHRTSAALDKGSWIGDDDAGNAFKKQFNIDQIDAFLAPGTYDPNPNAKQSPSGGAVTGGVVYLGTSARQAVENSLASDEQQRQQMDAARKKADANNTGSSGSSGASSSAAAASAAAKGSAAASPTTGASPTSGASQDSGTTADQAQKTTVNPDLFKGPLQWGVEGADGRWHALPAHADLNSKDYQGHLQWGVEGSDGKWYPLAANERPASIDDRGPLAHLMPASTEPTATDDRGPLMHIVPTVPSEVVGHHGQSTVDPQSGQQWQGQAAQTAEMVNGYQPTPAASAAHHHGAQAAVTSAETAPGRPTPELNASTDAVQQGVQHAAVTSAETAPGLPTPVQDVRGGGESPTES